MTAPKVDVPERARLRAEAEAIVAQPKHACGVECQLHEPSRRLLRALDALDAAERERDEERAKLARVMAQRDRLRRATTPDEHDADCLVRTRPDACTCGLDAALKETP